MVDYSLSQTVPISRLSRDYVGLIEESRRKNEPVVLLRHGKPVGAIVAAKVLERLLAVKRSWEEERVLNLVRDGDAEYERGETVTELP